MQIKQCITQTQKSVRLFIKRKVETASLFFFVMVFYIILFIKIF